MNKALLEQRKRTKAKKPNFVKQDAHKRGRIRKRWSKPRGWQSKMRLQKRGYNKLVSPGYGSPKAVYGFDPSGLQVIRVSTISGLKGLDAKTQGVLIPSSVGAKKKIELLKKAKEDGIKILNIKDPALFIKKVEENIKKKKEEKQKKAEKKKEAEKKKSKKKEEGLKEKLSEEEKKEEEKKEKDKLLIKKEK